MTVFATNVLGDGQASRSITIGMPVLSKLSAILKIGLLQFNPESTNNKVMVIVSQHFLTTITCKYLQPQTSSIKSCLIAYGPSTNTTCADPPYVTQVQKFTNSTIDVELSPFPKFHNETLFCYRVTASNGTSTVAVMGTFHVGKYFKICQYSLRVNK